MWIEEGRHDDPRDVLTAKGVRFSAGGRVDATHRLTTEDLAELLSDGDDEE